MKTPNAFLRGTAIAALFAIPFATGPAFAQTEQTQTGQIAQNQTQADAAAEAEDGTTAAGDGTAQSMDGSDGADGQQPDAVVATVGGTEIRGSDLMSAIGALPPQMQQQPPQMLIPMALEQLILRELVLAEARSQNLQDDPEVIALVEREAQTTEDNALVQIWLQREMEGAVTDEAVQQTYDQAVAEGQQNLPPLAQVRPQIEQFLRQQAMQDIQTRLREGADVVFYDPTGNPIDPQTGGQGQTGTTGGATDSGSTGGTTGSDTSGSTDDASGSDTGTDDSSDDMGTEGSDDSGSDDSTDGQSDNN
ncbi:hypothetical protein [Citreimonas sp.]|uniref:hypothetical protein n=1 Tax=Citreimonas sp. TaxID=3036715 RepID=UPI0035C7DFF1